MRLNLQTRDVTKNPEDEIITDYRRKKYQFRTVDGIRSIELLPVKKPRKNWTDDSGLYTCFMAFCIYTKKIMHDISVDDEMKFRMLMQCVLMGHNCIPAVDF